MRKEYWLCTQAGRYVDRRVERKEGKRSWVYITIVGNRERLLRFWGLLCGWRGGEMDGYGRLGRLGRFVGDQ